MKLVALLAAILATAAITTAVAFGGTQGSSMPVIDVAMDANSISVSGQLLSGAVDVHITTTGQNQAPIFVRLNPGVTADQFLAFLGSKRAQDPNNVAPYGSIVFDAQVTPGGSSDVQTILQPGDYVAVNGGGNGPPAEGDDATFTISQNSSPSKLPLPDEWQKSVEFKFRGPATLHTGQVIRASNVGWLVHMDIAIGVKSEAKGREVIKLLRAGQDKKIGPLATPAFFGLFGPVSHGAIQQFVFNAKPGWYVEACFMDTQDGREHTQLGMERLIHVVK